MSTNKELSKKLQSILKDLGHEISLGHAYELLARLSGFTDWNVAKARGATLTSNLTLDTNPDLTPKWNGKGYDFQFHCPDGQPVVFPNEITAHFVVTIIGSGNTLKDCALEAAEKFLEEVESYGSDCRTLEHNLMEVEIHGPEKWEASRFDSYMAGAKTLRLEDPAKRRKNVEAGIQLIKQDFQLTDSEREKVLKEMEDLLGK